MTSTTGYSKDELDDAQSRWGLRFPADLVELLRGRRKVDPESFDWIASDPAIIRNRIDWPFEGFWFDVQNGLWWPEWGEKPERPADQHDRLRSVFAAAPKLIPLASHRYLPEEPFERGNPVISVHQSDVIWFGATLSDWMKCETFDPSAQGASTKEVRFWSEAVRRSGNTTDWPYRDPSFFTRSSWAAKQTGRTVQIRSTIETERPPEGGPSKNEP